MNKQSAFNLQDIKVIQLGLNTADMVGTLRLYGDLFGFVNGGGNAIWGELIKIQDLPPDSRSLMWWMCGGTSYFQLELFHHTSPAQRQKPADWRPCDHGWVRFGVAVSDFDRVTRGLARWKIPVIGNSGTKGSRRLAFRDPFVGVIVEAVESTAKTCPYILYGTNSVADLAAAKRLYEKAIGATLEPLEKLHTPADEALWGLTNATRDGFVVSFGDTSFEIVCYSNPKGRPRPDDRKISDQGIMNLALGSRDANAIRGLIERIRSDGYEPTVVIDGSGVVATYFNGVGCELEVVSTQEEADAPLGFVPSVPFLPETVVSDS